MASERWPNGGSRAWRKKRAEVLERDGGRCTHRARGDKLVPGVRVTKDRCDRTAELEVHHLVPGAAAEAPLDELITVCKEHHPPADAAWQADAAAAAALAAVKTLQVQELDIRALMPAVWNANSVSRETMQRIEKSIRTFGVVENVVVRPHPEFPDKYEVLSGNHRLQIFKRLRMKKVAAHIIDVDDAHARILAQVLNRERGVDDPEKRAALLEAIHAALPKDVVDEFLTNIAKLPPGGLDGKSMTRLLQHQKDHDGIGYQFKAINPMKLGQRLEACAHPRRMEKALELFAGRGQLTFWYRRLFEKVVRVDIDGEGDPDHRMSATEYLRTRFAEDGPFDLIDFDDEGSPHEELDVFFEVIAKKRLQPFVLCVTDGLAHRLKLIRKIPTDLYAVYRWPERAAADKHLYLRCPELLDHGIRTRAEEAGYTAETISVEWKPGKSATFGAWLVGPEEDTRTDVEKTLEEDETPVAWGAWRIAPKPPRQRKPPVEALPKRTKGDAS